MSHYTATAERAAVVNAAAGAPLALGSIVLNHAVGGLNATAVEVAARQGARFVWLPTVSALGEFAKVERADGNVPVWVRFEVELRAAGALPRPVPVLDDAGDPLAGSARGAAGGRRARPRARDGPSLARGDLRGRRRAVRPA